MLTMEHVVPNSPERDMSATDLENGNKGIRRSGSKTAREVKEALGTSGKVLNQADSDMLDLLHEWDQTGDGQFSVEEVMLIARKFQQKERQVRTLSRTLALGAVFAIMLLVGVLLVTLGADEMSKDTRPDVRGVLTTKDGNVVSVAHAYQTGKLDFVPRMSDTELAQLQFLSFDVESEHHILKVAGVVRRLSEVQASDSLGSAIDVFFVSDHVTKLSFDGGVELQYQNGTSKVLVAGRRLGDSASADPWMHRGEVGISGRWDASPNSAAVARRRGAWSHPGPYR